MSRRYFEPVRVRTCPEPGCPDGLEAPPGEFTWRGRCYRVQTVVAHWIEGGSWWRRADRSGERQVWRVEAAHRSAAAGVYDLSCDATAGRWHLVRALD